MTRLPIKVAIVGGGCAGITAAFELTRPVHEGKYEVTVYQLGWRLGGKGASGRGPSDRIEEHGLHLWNSCCRTRQDRFTNPRFSVDEHVEICNSFGNWLNSKATNGPLR